MLKAQLKLLIVGLSETSHRGYLLSPRHFHLSRYRDKVGRDLDLTRIGVLPNKYKKGKGIFKEMIILIANGISGRKDIRISKEVVESMDFNSESGIETVIRAIV